ncbi:protein-S-isoprenylcysteine O-methyltransferase ste14 [Fadolivirus algeromassiliense]|jgi:protein-S-isoprenylcysteine O-methyltransferase Ste14|uniref:Protein-S-isoprenylcysteine O-methyltransferase ste14 n=1 Tax=Fadolivirus FV1/VV64 TaxID=3070911 RepID=A0A7D3V565_9VIRU|nr:protein-S-isoprenylcysteine O-methyltransferase ste14 [Fadolivirus algeromassiliense]QKF93595.1 protein-S-isoprenylcysteine O-methyltransferase ste14 [Fadolivirus FV1/VV64]
MINTFRLFCICIQHIYIYLAHVSPNSGNEISHLDKVLDQGNVGGFFKRFIVLTIMTEVMAFYNLLYYYDKSLSLFEVLFFILMTCGFVLRMWSYYTLNKLFTFTLAIKENHRLVTDGPYKYLIHPSYSGHLLMMYCYILFNGFYWLFPLLGYYNFKLLLKRTRAEEAMLREKFGAEYDEFIKGRYRFIPFIY